MAFRSCWTLYIGKDLPQEHCIQLENILIEIPADDGTPVDDELVTLKNRWDIQSTKKYIIKHTPEYVRHIFC